MTRGDIQGVGHLLHNGLRSLSSYSRRNIEEKLKTYFKFLVARYPAERLLSAFRSKFGKAPMVQAGFERYGRSIKRYGDGELSFANFIEYLTDRYENYTTKIGNKNKNQSCDLSKQWLSRGCRYFEPHWAQYATLCHPCHVDYDYIVKFETMREDAAYVLSKLGPHDQCLEDKYPELFSFTQTSSSRMNEFYADLSTKQTDKVNEMYKIDFKLFGYDNKYL